MLRMLLLVASIATLSFASTFMARRLAGASPLPPKAPIAKTVAVPIDRAALDVSVSRRVPAYPEPEPVVASYALSSDSLGGGSAGVSDVSAVGGGTGIEVTKASQGSRPYGIGLNGCGC